MFRFFIIPVSILLLAGCATKPVATVVLDPYVPSPAAFQKCGTIYISGISDKRKQPDVIGEIVKEGKPVTVVKSAQDMKAWFKDALRAALKEEGCKITPKSTHASNIARVYVRIDKVSAKLDRDKLTGENLEAGVYVTLFMRQGKSERIIKKIGLTQRKWVPPLSGETAVKEYLQETLDQVVNMVVEEIDNYRF
ncbi:YajG family lipoprotein [Hydrogenimonas sp. SS33]|uniref:YajG family lipoprotein n=1 Tax=Hydrogenimonas leucolamina TaxID=2954236 RepID=UPI00336BF315